MTRLLRAKAVANATTASFISMVGSEFVQKYLGEGPRMVRDVFRLARENAPSIVFIDEIDAIATKRFDAQTGADREVRPCPYPSLSSPSCSYPELPPLTFPLPLLSVVCRSSVFCWSC